MPTLMAVDFFVDEKFLKDQKSKVRKQNGLPSGIMV